MADDDDEQDPNAGSTHLKNFMSEAQPSREDGGLKMGRNTGTKGTDSYYSQKYGKDVDLSGDSTPVSVNRRAKGDITGSPSGKRDKTLRYD